MKTGVAMKYIMMFIASGLPFFLFADEKLAAELEKDVKAIADQIGERHLEKYDKLCEAADYIAGEFKSAGLAPQIQEYKVPKGKLSSAWNVTDYWNQTYKNVWAEIKGSEKPDEIIVVGAHYDSVARHNCKGANDNASGVAAVLAAARKFSGGKFKRTIRFVAFANEEPPFFFTNYMGSYVFAKACKDKKEKIIAMLCPETIGYYSDEKDSQSYPPGLSLFYPTTGNFIAFASNFGSRKLISKCKKYFTESIGDKLPCVSAALPVIVPMLMASDHWSFYRCGYNSVMITDTAPFRYPYYHTSEDNYDKINYPKMAIAVSGIFYVLEKLAQAEDL